MQLKTENELKRLSRTMRGFMRTAEVILLDHEARPIETGEADEEDDD